MSAFYWCPPSIRILRKLKQNTLELRIREYSSDNRIRRILCLSLEPHFYCGSCALPANVVHSAFAVGSPNTISTLNCLSGAIHEALLHLTLFLLFVWFITLFLLPIFVTCPFSILELFQLQYFHSMMTIMLMCWNCSNDLPVTDTDV